MDDKAQGRIKEAAVAFTGEEKVDGQAQQANAEPEEQRRREEPAKSGPKRSGRRGPLRKEG